MKWRNWILCASLALAAGLRAEDKVSAEFQGSNSVEGINFDGVIIGDTSPFSTFTTHPASAKISVTTKDGGVHHIETYQYWSAENSVRGYVWEKLWVSGSAYTGWSERLIQTPFHVIFSRTVINGTIDQKIRPDGSGYAEWTVAGSDNGVDNTGSDTSDNSDTSSSTDTSGTSSDTSSTTTTDTSSGNDLPTVDIMEEGTFDGVSERRITISPDDHGHPTLSFTDHGYTRAQLTELGVSQDWTIDQRLQFEGKGEGSVAYIPVEQPSSSASPTPTPTPTPVVPTPTPTPIPTDTTTGVDTTDTGTDGTDFNF